MKIVNHSQCEETALPVEGARDAFLRSLIAQQDGAQNFVMFSIRILPGGCTPVHDHGWEEAIFVLRGSGEAPGSPDEPPRAIRAGDVIFTPAGYTHGCRNTGEEDLELICLVPDTNRAALQEKSPHPVKLTGFERIVEQPVDDREVKGVFIRVLVGPDDGAPNFVMRRFRVAPGGYTPRHQHPWEHEVFVLEGRGEIETPDGPKPLASGDAVFVPADELHQFRNNGPDDLEFLCVIPHPQT